MTELAQAQELPLATASGDALTTVRLGVGWAKARTAGAIGTGAPDIDLDATALQFAGGRLFDLAFYNHLRTRDGSVVHLGDNTTGRGEGDDEQLTVDLTKVHGPVDTILFLVSSYQGHSLEWIPDAYCRLLDDAAGGVEVARYRLTLGIRATGVVLAALVRSGAGWTLRTIGRGVPITVPTENLDVLTPFV